MRKQEGQGPAAGQWLCFDDNQVEPWDVANLDRDCFGGKQSESGFADRGLLTQVEIPLLVELSACDFVTSRVCYVLSLAVKTVLMLCHWLAF